MTAQTAGRQVKASHVVRKKNDEINAIGFDANSFHSTFC
jgi:hypothetical protein